jgi:hypothetical protein
MDAPSAEIIATAISIFYANPKADQETILQALDNAGIPPREAWELYQFLPIAFVHVAFRDQGVVFTPDYELDAAGSSARTRHKSRTSRSTSPASPLPKVRSGTGALPLNCARCSVTAPSMPPS